MLSIYCSLNVLPMVPSCTPIRFSSSSLKPSTHNSNEVNENSLRKKFNNDSSYDEDILIGKGSSLGRDLLVQKPLWEQYSSKVKARMENPKFRGEITNEDASAIDCDLIVVDHGSEACGDMVRLFWAITRNKDGSKKPGIIKKARFQTFGCGTAIAASDVTAEMCIGLTVAEAKKLVTSAAVEKALRDDPNIPAVPPQKMHCSVMSSDVVRKAAIAATEDKSGSQHKVRPEDEVICQCAGVTLGTVRNAIREHNLKTVAQITEYTKAGGFCGSCVKKGGHEARKKYLVDILRDELEIARIQKLIELEISELLKMHAGNVLCVGVKFDENETTNKKTLTEVLLKFIGACAGCGEARFGTVSFVEAKLRKHFESSVKFHWV